MTNRFLQAIKKTNRFSENEMEKISYAWKSILSDVSKIFILTIIASAVGEVKRFVCIFVSYVLLRVFNGGVHCDTYIKCLLSTGAWVFAGVIISKLIIINDWFMLGGVIGIIILLCLGPIQSPKKRKMDKTKIEQQKVWTLFIGMVLLIICMLNKDKPISVSLLCGIWIECIQISIIYMERRRRKWKSSLKM